jgi:membrane protein implicated in regulation of membrane protease activity
MDRNLRIKIKAVVRRAAEKREKENERTAELEEMTAKGLAPVTEAGDGYVMVNFDDGKSHVYRCPFNVKVGDKVKVHGKRRGQLGTVTEIGLTAVWAESATRAYRAQEQA